MSTVDSPSLSVPSAVPVGKTLSWASNASNDHDSANWNNVDEKFDSLRQKEQPLINGNLHFFQLHQMIQSKSDLFHLFQKLPKGGLLHAHADALVDLKWVLQQAIADPKCHYRIIPGFDNVPRPDFCFFDKAPEGQGWEPIAQTVEKAGGKDAFISSTYKRMTLLVDNPDTAFKNDSEAWAHFNNCFMTMDGLSHYLPFFRQYFAETLKRYLADNLIHMEMRLVHFKPYESNGTEHEFDKAFEVIDEELTKFKASHPELGYFGVKIIYAVVRFIDNDEMRWHLKNARRLRQKYPHIIAGFDMVGDEGKLKPIEYYQKELMESLEYDKANRAAGKDEVDLPFFWHAGEGLNDRATLKRNLQQAIELDTKRIGHGILLPQYWSDVSAGLASKDICVEISPISNHLLYALHMQGSKHHFPELYKANVPIAISSDDPALFGYEGVSPDYYYIFMTNNYLKLVDLQKLVRSTITGSALSDQEKQKALDFLDEQWEKFIEEVSK